MSPAVLVGPIGELDPGFAEQVRPGMRRVARLLLRYRWPLIFALAAVYGLFVTGLPLDTPQFARLGDAMLRGHLRAVYGDSWNQSGPLQLALSTLLFEAGRSTIGSLCLHVAGNVLALALVRWGCIAVRRQAGLDRSALVEVAVGGACLVWLLPGRLWQAHPAEFAIPLLWVAAGAGARGQRPLRTGLLLGLAMCWEPWGILAAPVAMLLTGWPARLRAAGIAAATTLLGYGPFAASGSFRIFQHVWQVGQPTTPLHYLFPSIHAVPWPLRCAQAVLSLLACGAVVALLRRSPAVIWLAPAAAVLVRFVLDPYILDYYWSAVSVLTLAGACLLTRRTSVAQAVPLAALGYLPLCVYGPPTRYVVLSLIALAAAVGGELLAISRSRRGRAPRAAAARPAAPAPRGAGRPARPR